MSLNVLIYGTTIQWSMAKVIVVNGAISMLTPAPGIFSFDRCASTPRNALNFHGIALFARAGNSTGCASPTPTAGQLCGVVCLNEAAKMTLHSIQTDNDVPDKMAWAIAVMGMFVTS